MLIRMVPHRCRLGLALLTWASVGLAAQADPPRSEANPAKAPVTVPMDTLDSKDWLKVSTSPLQAGEIDRLVGEHLRKSGIKPAPLVGDELFLRRVYLDLTGHLPMPADIREFLADKRADKRARVIDTLLDGDAYAEHWALYWRNVIASKVTDFKGLFGVRGFDVWMTAHLKANRSWGEITRELLTAGGTIDLDEPEKNGQAWFLSTRFGMDSPTELAGETSRIFLGIQIQCAQCHDHPSDVWKRRQFHEFAAYFARTREQPVFDKEKKRFTSVKLVSLPFAEHQIPGKEDPKKGTVVHPTFLDGESPGKRLSDDKRRSALATSITSKDNPWFAAAYVNRMWGTLLGQAFYQPIDDLGPQKEAVMPDVIARVAGSFRGNSYDMKQLLRDVMNSEAYQRDVRSGASPEEHVMFAGRTPVRMDADTLWNTLSGTLGKMGGPAFPAKGPAGPFARLAGLEGQFKQEFGFDPSAKAEEVEGSISQALLLMNNPQVHQKIRAQGTNLLARILSAYPNDADALEMVYLRTLARHPNAKEAARCDSHIQRVGNRAEAYEDILWALINSTEYQTKR
jgi:Protein of unknown function (DUF1549)/Protein of unknown function (DUF1553)